MNQEEEETKGWGDEGGGWGWRWGWGRRLQEIIFIEKPKEMNGLWKDKLWILNLEDGNSDDKMRDGTKVWKLREDYYLYHDKKMKKWW